MTKGVSLWMITNKDVTIQVRAGAWEVAFPAADGERTMTVIVSGPEARVWAEKLRDFIETELLLA